VLSAQGSFADRVDSDYNMDQTVESERRKVCIRDSGWSVNKRLLKVFDLEEFS
jgi:hypothetical protein